MAKKALSKATVIRKCLAKHPKATASEVVKALALNGFKVPLALVHVVKARLTKPKRKTEGTDRQKRFWLSTVRIENATQEGEPFLIVLTFSDGKRAILDFENGESFAAADLRDALDVWVGLDRFDRYDDRPSLKRRNAHEALLAEHGVNPGDVVLDPMCGSGTTCLAAQSMGRQFIGIDISKEYCELARTRLKCACLSVPMMAA